MKKLLFLCIIQILTLGLNALAGETQFEVFTPSVKSEDRQSGPLLGQLQPVNQINLMESYHLLDVDFSYSQWSGDLPPDSYYQLANVETVKSQESSFNLRYAYGLFRHTYFGVNIGFLQRSEADFSRNEGPIDPDFFIGQHFPWENGNLRLSFNASPSFGKSTKTMSLSDEGQTFKGNALRGGFKVKPAVAVYSRMGPVIIGSEANYSYFGRRIVETENPVGQNNMYDQQSGYHLYNYNGVYNSNYANQTAYSNPEYYNFPSTLYQQEITGGNVVGLKVNLEVPKWQRLGAEWMYDMVQSQHVQLENRAGYDTDAYNQNKFKTYARFKLTNQMSLIPEVNWIQAPPDGIYLTKNNQDIWLFGLTFRSKFN
jgi:hypothetical protein